MSLLTICQDASAEIGIPEPSGIVGIGGDSQKLLRNANKVGKRLATAFSWQVLTKEQTFTALGQQEQTAILPDDFDRFIPETFWNRSLVEPMSGPVGSTEWQSLQAANTTPTYKKFRYRGDSVYIYPAPTAGNTLAFEYVSNQWCQSASGDGQTVWAMDTDTGIIDEELITLGVIYEHKKIEGLDWQTAAADYMDRFKVLTRNDRPELAVMTHGDIFGAGRHFAGAPMAGGILAS